MTDNLPAVSGFDYAVMPIEDASVARAAATVIRARLHRTTEDMFEVGRQLVAAKAALPHGQWLPWLAAECDLAERTAQEFMRSAAFAGDAVESAKFADLSPSTVAKLAAAPKAVQAEIVEKVEAGERVLLSDVVDAVRAVRDAKAPKPATEPEAAPASSPMAFSAGIADTFADIQRYAAVRWGQDLQVAAADIVHAGDAAATKRCTKAWAIETAAMLSRLITDALHLTGGAMTWDLAGITLPESVAVVFRVIVDVYRRCDHVKNAGWEAPSAEDLAGWRDRLVAAGLSISHSRKAPLPPELAPPPAPKSADAGRWPGMKS